MAVEVKDIVDRESFKKWLHEQDNDDLSRALANRISLRILPRVLSVFQIENAKLDHQIKRDLTLQTFRASFISAVAHIYPIEDMRNVAVSSANSVAKAATTSAFRSSAHSAARSVRSTVYTAADSANSMARNCADAAASSVDSAYTAAYITARSASSSAHSAYSADSAVSAVWELIRHDINWLAGRDPSHFSSAPLWLNTLEEEWSEVVTLQENILGSITQFRNSEECKENHWGLWLAWYDAQLQNPPVSRFGKRVDLEIALQPDEFWNRDATVVMGELAEIVGWPFGESGTELKPATVMPGWQNGVLVQTRPPSSTDLKQQIAVAALAAVKAELIDLAEELATEGNLDRRAAGFLDKTAGMIPDHYPDIPTLFALSIREGVMVDYQKGVSLEWPQLLASRYGAVCTEFSIALDRFEERREFESDVLDKELEGYDADQVTAFVEEATGTLRNDVLTGIVDSSIPDALENSLHQLPDANTQELPVAVSQNTVTRIKSDQIESLANIGKQLSVDLEEAEIARLVMEGKAVYAQTLKDEYLEASKDVAKEDARKIARAANRTQLGAATGNALFSRLKKAFPKRFRWLVGNED